MDGSGGISDRNVIAAKDETTCKENKGFSWLADKSVCAADCMPPAVANWDNVRQKPICISPAGAEIDARGARADINEHGDPYTGSYSSGSSGSSIQSKADEAARQTDVFYRDSKSGIEIPATVPMGYLIVAGIGLALGFMVFRR